MSKPGASLLDDFDMNRLIDLSVCAKPYQYKTISKTNNNSKIINEEEFGGSTSEIVLNVHGPDQKEDTTHQSIDCSGRLSKLVREMDAKFKSNEVPTNLSIKSYKSEGLPSEVISGTPSNINDLTLDGSN